MAVEQAERTPRARPRVRSSQPHPQPKRRLAEPALPRVLITGGAGFIGSHLADHLLAHGYAVRVLDNLSAPAHGGRRDMPEHLNPEAEFLLGDVCDGAAVRRALRRVDAVVHLAAAVGAGPSLCAIDRYTATNNGGAATLLRALIDHPVGRLVLASSRDIYGEGLYRSGDGALHSGVERPVEQLRAGAWDPRDASGAPLEPLPTPETQPPAPASIYALSKYDQERMAFLVGEAYAIPTTALRLFNVYGARQTPADPCAGVLAVFAARLMKDKPPVLFEDGLQRRDFVHVQDVAKACRLALEKPEAAGRALNIGSGRARTIRETAERMARLLGKEALRPEVAGRYRVGDVRHGFADIGQARAVLGFEPEVAFEDGVIGLAEWLAGRSRPAPV